MICTSLSGRNQPAGFYVIDPSQIPESARAGQINNKKVPMGNVLQMPDDSLGEQVWKASQAGNAELLAEYKQLYLNQDTRKHMEWRDKVSGRTPLMMAASYGRIECVQILLEAGAELNAQDEGKEHHTALHYAVIMGHPSIVQALLEHNDDAANVAQIVNARGATALDAARTRYAAEAYADANVYQCIQLLETHLTLYKGWLFHTTDNAVSKVAKFAALSSWNKRYVCA